MYKDAAEFLETLDSVHKRTRRVIECVPRDELEWRPAAGKFSFGDLVRHLANIERWMYAENVKGKPSKYSGHGPEFAAGWDNVLAYYDSQHADSRAIFATLSPTDLGGKSVTPAGTPITTWKWLRAMLEHEAHHRGQIYLMLGILGVVTPPIYGLTSEEVAARRA